MPVVFAGEDVQVAGACFQGLFETAGPLFRRDGGGGLTRTLAGDDLHGGSAGEANRLGDKPVPGHVLRGLARWGDDALAPGAVGGTFEEELEDGIELGPEVLRGCHRSIVGEREAGVYRPGER
ncbi:MAG: hypothetical protein IPF51_08995 [Dehalococcoidia bacterium]|uniref:hypothetical protein n=1 Tax=Candidatus Amarobacter glycogenicus TaxID=3140699 RepID=UPI003135F2C3|nr:hypothetical protein [Dehalococcoidia bacterium]